MKQSKKHTHPGHEPDQRGPWWSHPYAVYVGATILLFGFLILMGWLATVNDWLPQRGAY